MIQKLTGLGTKRKKKMIELLTAAWMIFMSVIWEKNNRLDLFIKLIFLAFAIVWSVKTGIAFGYINQV